MTYDGQSATACRFDRLSWAIGFATGLLLGTVVVAWVVILR